LTIFRGRAIVEYMTTKKTTKKEEEKATPEQVQQSAAQAINSYFTQEVNQAVSELTNDVMFARLRQLEASEYWYAILRYNNLRLLTAQSALNSLDPIISASAISKTQGQMQGIVDLQNCVIQLVEIEKQAAKDIQEINENF